MISLFHKIPVKNSWTSRWVFVWVLFCLCNFKSIGQEYQEAQIKLRDGSKLEGQMIGTLDSSYLKFRLVNLQPIIINYSDIKSIRFYHSSSSHSKSMIDYEASNYVSTNAFFHEVLGGLLMGDDHPGFTLHTINGYQFSQYLGTGLGIGVDRYENHTTLPIYGQVKGYLKGTRISPYYYGGLGYGFAWSNNSNEVYGGQVDVVGGFVWQAGLGYRFSFKSVALNINMGYKNQQVKTEYVYRRPWDISDMEVTEKRKLRRFVLAIGISI